MPRITYIVDACALIAYFKGENGKEKFVELLLDEQNIFGMHIVNLCEVYYGYYRSDGQTKADEAWNKSLSFLQILDNSDTPFIKRVGRWKALHSLPLGDAFAAASAENDAVPLLTTDHGDFDAIERDGLLEIEWIR